jgi:acetyl esterase/lipase
LPSSTPANDPIFQSLYEEKVTYIGGASLEGQSEGGASGPPSTPNLSDPRQLFVLNMIAQGRVVESIWPSAPKDLHLIDPVLNVHSDWPPTAFVHGTKDFMIPMEMSQYMEIKLRSAGVETAFFPVPDEPHTFVGQMLKGSATWHKQREGFDFLERILRRTYS